MIVGRNYYDLSLVAVHIGGCKEHGVGFQSSHLPGLEVGYDNDVLSEKRFGRTVFLQPGDNLPLLGSKVDIQDEQFVGIGMVADSRYLRNAKIEFAEVVVTDDRLCLIVHFLAP